MTHEKKLHIDLLVGYKSSTVLKKNIADMKLGTEHKKFKVGQVIWFTAGYNSDIRYKTEITGFSDSGDIYLLWDCYWFPIQDDVNRDIVLVE